MIRDFDNFCDRHFAGSNQKDSIGMKNLFGLKNPAWKYLRTKITPTLTRGKLKQMFPLMTEIGEPMMDYLKNHPKDRDGVKLVDAQELSYKYTTDLIASIALGTKMDSFHYPNEEFSTEVHEFFHGFKRMVALVTVFFVPELIELIGTRILANSSFVKKVFWNAMENREKTGEKRGDFIDSLLQLKHGKQNPNYKFEGENLLYQSGTFFSGFESSSTCMSFTLMELANHSKYQKLARQDINRAIDKHGWTYEAFQEKHSMKYLDQTIAEGLRLHPPVSTIDRCTRQNYKKSLRKKKNRWCLKLSLTLEEDKLITSPSLVNVSVKRELEDNFLSDKMECKPIIKTTSSTSDDYDEWLDIQKELGIYSSTTDTLRCKKDNNDSGGNNACAHGCYEIIEN
ncbi:cytochrome p450 6k1 [Lasius niger]|uniref:Cytochrome p450 6k1 n=1 Tax=Lasius niger TaxID=67767 RepID=A0A0J7K3I0_LASNI|nr:cytochrome p450 6k1 [Lasius niger]